MSESLAIRVNHVGKAFKLPHEKSTSVKGALINRFKGGNRGYEIQEVIKDISFDVERGDFFGIVGRNGSGKSTLLKMLAGIYTPTRGDIQVNGKLTPFIELGVGFNPDLSGRDNVYLNGALLGFNRDDMDKMYDEIVSFAELEKFMDQKLKNYSSGMQVRLAFSIAIRANPDILVLDEVLAVGDEAFQKKCTDFFSRMKKDKKRTIILVTHSMDAVRRYCNRALLLEKGEIIAYGDPNDVADEYSKQFIDSNTPAAKEDNQQRFGKGDVVYEKISHKLTAKEFVLDFDILNTTEEDYKDITMGFDFCINDDPIIGNDTRYLEDYKSGIQLAANTRKHFTVKFPNNFGKYPFTLIMNLTTGLGTDVSDYIRPAIEFDSNNVRYGSAFKLLTTPEIRESEPK